jgi:hypothetical protein
MRVTNSLVAVTGSRASVLRAPFLSSPSSCRTLLIPVNGRTRPPSVFVRTFVTVGPNGEKLTQGLKANGLYDPANEHGESTDLLNVTLKWPFLHHPR